MLIRKVLFTILIISTLNAHSQNLESDLSGFVEDLYSTIEPELIPTGILLDQGFSDIKNLFPSNASCISLSILEIKKELVSSKYRMEISLGWTLLIHFNFSISFKLVMILCYL